MKRVLLSILLLGSFVSKAMEKEMWQNEEIVISSDDRLLFDHVKQPQETRRRLERVLENADVNVQDQHGMTPLHYAAQIGNGEIVSCLLQYGADKNKTNRQEETAYDIAHERVKFLLTNYEVIAFRNGEEKGDSSDEFVPQKDNKRKGALIESPKKKRPRLNTPALTPEQCNDSFKYAARSGKKELLEYYIKNGADIDQVNSNGNTALHVAVRNGRKGSVIFLLNNGADTNIRNKKGNTVFDEAPASVLPLLENALKMRAMPTNRTKHKQNTSSKNIQQVDASMNQVMPILDPHTQNDNGVVLSSSIGQNNTTQWHQGFAMTYQPQVANVYAGYQNGGMLEQRTQFVTNHTVDPQPPSTFTPMTTFALQSNPATVMNWQSTPALPSFNAAFSHIQLPEQNTIDERMTYTFEQPETFPAMKPLLPLSTESALIDPLTVDENRRTVLHRAAAHNVKELVTALIHCGADINARDYQGLTPLHCTILFGRIDIADLLLRMGALVNLRDNGGRTPLMAAATISPDMVNLLIFHKAHLEHYDKNGKSFKDYLLPHFKGLFLHK